jgi:phosphatidylglycerophosphate synthase
MLSKLKPKAEPFINKIARLFIDVDPNILTLLGLIPPLLFFVLLYFHLYWWALFSAIGILFDTLDGAVARLSGKVSHAGMFLDSSFDRLADTIYIGAFYFAGIVRPGIIIPLIAASIIISYVKSAYIVSAQAAKPKEKAVFNTGIIERPERLILIFGSLFLFILNPTFRWASFTIIEIGFTLLLLLSGITVLQRLIKGFLFLRK